MNEKYYHTKESVQEYIRLAQGVNGEGLIKRLNEFLPSQSVMLELGSGPGTDWNILNKRYQVVGSDNSKQFLEHLASTLPHGTFLELDAVTLQTEKHFDGIYSNKVLHHLTTDELNLSIKRQASILNDGGLVCHSFWKGEGSEDFKGMFVQYHSEESLKDLFQGHFKIIVLEE